VKKLLALSTCFLAVACTTPPPDQVAQSGDMTCSMGFPTGSAIAVKRCLTPEQVEEQRKAAEQVKSQIRDAPRIPPKRE
jgi:hypothetical protein